MITKEMTRIRDDKGIFSICMIQCSELHEKRLLITTWQSVGRPKSYVLQKITLMALLSIRRERQICDERKTHQKKGEGENVQ